MRVLFVGDKPSLRNFDPKVAFEGTVSGETLKTWAMFMGVNDDYMAINRVDEFFIDCAKSFSNVGKPVVALGFEAHKALTRAGIPHFELPHPSGKNRKLNDVEALAKDLLRCSRYIQSCYLALRGW